MYCPKSADNVVFVVVSSARNSMKRLLLTREYPQLKACPTVAFMRERSRQRSLAGWHLHNPFVLLTRKYWSGTQQERTQSGEAMRPTQSPVVPRSSIYDTPCWQLATSVRLSSTERCFQRSSGYPPMLLDANYYQIPWTLSVIKHCLHPAIRNLDLFFQPQPAIYYDA